MKKKTLIVLLIIPFIIGLISFVSVVLLNITVASDISGITWAYQETEAFKISTEGYKLVAEPEINNANLIIRPGNELVWEVVEGEDVVEIRQDENGDYYLYTKKEGNATIVCRTENGNVQKKLNVIVYENGTITINPIRKRADNPIESVRYFGEFDVSDSSKNEMNGLVKEKASFEIKTQVYGDNISNQAVRMSDESSDNISFENNVITINDASETTATLVLESVEKPYIKNSYTFNVVPNGVNVYSYNDLLLTTNYSQNGEISVMQTNLGSAREVYNGTDYDIGANQGAITFIPDTTLSRKDPEANIELFGNIIGYDKNGVPNFNFANELYVTETSYSHEFADAYNEANPDTPLDTDIKVGLRVQKDFYGNGYSINMNNLCFPNHGEIDSEVKKLSPNKELDYFFGPLSYVTIGNSHLEVVRAFGQDNVGMMLDGDNITLNDLKIQNIDDNSNKRNYSYIGTVVEVDGINNTIKNSEIKLGKNLVRAFDADKFTLSNSILRRSGEFNLMVGSNKVNKVDENASVNINGQASSFKDFFNLENKSANSANAYLESFLDLGSYANMFYDGEFANVSGSELNKALLSMQSSLDNSSSYYDASGNKIYASEITINDTDFSESGIFSIAFETMFNGPFLYNGLSYTVKTALGDLLSSVLPNKIGGTSSPVKITLKGDTSFNDWKKIDDIDLTNLIEERLSLFLEQQDVEMELGIDQFFPLKAMLKDLTNAYSYKDDEGNPWINTMVAYYGGGLNLSDLVDKRDSATVEDAGQKVNVDILSNFNKYVSISGEGALGMIPSILSKCVLFAIGFNPFNFIVNRSGSVPPSDILNSTVN